MARWHDVVTVRPVPDDRLVEVVFGDGVVVEYHPNDDALKASPEDLVGRLAIASDAIAPLRPDDQ